MRDDLHAEKQVLFSGSAADREIEKTLTLITEKDDIQGDGVIDQVDAKT